MPTSCDFKGVDGFIFVRDMRSEIENGQYWKCLEKTIKKVHKKCDSIMRFLRFEKKFAIMAFYFLKGFLNDE